MHTSSPRNLVCHTQTRRVVSYESEIVKCIKAKPMAKYQLYHAKNLTRQVFENRFFSKRNSLQVARCFFLPRFWITIYHIGCSVSASFDQTSVYSVKRHDSDKNNSQISGVLTFFSIVHIWNGWFSLPGDLHSSTRISDPRSNDKAASMKLVAHAQGRYRVNVVSFPPPLTSSPGSCPPLIATHHS